MGQGLVPNQEGQQTWANSSSVVIASDQSAVPVYTGVVDSGNSTTTPLNAAATFTARTVTGTAAYVLATLNTREDQ